MLIIMDLDVKPTLENVERLKASPYKNLAGYEQRLVDASKTVRALTFICEDDHRVLVNKFENLTKENWMRVSRFANITNFPDNYFDIVLWSDCDLESELRQVRKIYPKLKQGGRIYFDNLLKDFDKVLGACLGKKDSRLLLGQKLTKSLEKSHKYAEIVQSILQFIFNSLPEKYLVHIIIYGKTYHLVIVKSDLKFEPDTDLDAEFMQVDKMIKQRFPAEPIVYLAPSLIEKIRNRIFILVTLSLRKGDTVKASELCEQLGKEKLLDDCKNLKILTDAHIGAIRNAVQMVDDQIDTLISIGTMDVQEIVNNFKDILDLDVADIDHWNKYITQNAAERLKDIYVEEEEEEEDVEEEEEEEEDVEEEDVEEDVEEEEEDVEEEEEEEDVEEDVKEDVEEEEEEEEYPEPREQAGKLPPILLPGLMNIGGFSCFMDSILFPILLPDGGYFDKKMVKTRLSIDNVTTCSYFTDEPTEGLEYLERFQNELRKLSILMRTSADPGITCFPIVQQMKKCGELQRELLGGEEQDDSEFLIALMEMFQLQPTVVNATRRVSVDKINWIQTSSVDEHRAILEIYIPRNVTKPQELLEWYQRVQIADHKNIPEGSWPKGPDGKTYRYSQEKDTVKTSDALLFHVARRIYVRGKYIKNTQPIILRKYIENKRARKHFELQIVTRHSGGAHGGHYTAYFKYASSWFYYDDIGKTRVRQALWKEVSEVGATSGSMYMYFPID